MKLTNKCKQDFETWFLKGVRTEENYDQYLMRSFNSKVDSMKLGVIIDFFNSKQYQGNRMFDYIFNRYYATKIELQTVPDIIKQTIENLNNLYNELNN